MNEYPGCNLHQIGPYIGKMRPALARQLIMRYSAENDLLWDPFSGSGTVSLESRLLNRHVIAGDINPYACALTRAKVFATESEDISYRQLSVAIKAVRNSPDQEATEAPSWVMAFFHPQTLAETRGLMSEFLRTKQYFNAGCLLGILHHQRPGFLSYPASHLVPYLRDRLFPRSQFPEAYQYRDPVTRMEAKIKRILRYPPPPRMSTVQVFQKSIFQKYLSRDSVDLVITSPPYMDALDYARDNRLRLWFLGVDNYKDVKKKKLARSVISKKIF